MRRVVLAVTASILIGACCHGPALAAPCPAGEVWGDLGCRPKAQPSIAARAAKRIKSRFRKPRTPDANPN
jgi:hypothetical protein